MQHTCRMLVWHTWMRLMYPTNFRTASILAVELRPEAGPPGWLPEEEGAEVAAWTVAAWLSV